MKSAILLILLLSLTACTTGGATKALATPSSCFDTDGGKVYDHAGTVSITLSNNEKKSFRDYCDNSRYLIENYCDGGNIPRTEVINCKCMNNACV